jgi:DNA-binding winged helix-turn-helix (wHTH) protein
MVGQATKTQALLFGAPQKFQRPQRPDEAISRVWLESLQAVAEELAAPLPLVRIATIVGEAAMDLLEAEIIVVAVHIDDPRHLRGVHIAGIPPGGQAQLSAAPCDEAGLVEEIDLLLGGNGAPRATASLAVLPIQQVVCPRGLMVVGRLRGWPFSEVERAFASVLAGLCGLALDRLRLSAERSRDRRRQHAPETVATHVRVGDMDIDLVGHSVSMDGRVAALTTSEMRLLTFLAQPPGRARSRREILRHLWQTEHVGDERACDAHISNLRRKIERLPSRPERLVTLRGYGYTLMPR